MALAAILVALNTNAHGQSQTVRGGNGVTLPRPPASAALLVTDDYNQTRIDDAYRWLEDSKSPQTRAWIDAQNQYTTSFLSQIKIRPRIAEELTQFERIDEYGLPVLRAGKYFFTKRLAGENQASIYLRAGWKGEDRRLVDATKLSQDQNTSIEIDDVSKDGRLLVYGVRQGGSDEMSIHVLDAGKEQMLADVLPAGRYFDVLLSPNNKGLFYALFTPSGSNVFFHTLGQSPQSDRKILAANIKARSWEG